MSGEGLLNAASTLMFSRSIYDIFFPRARFVLGVVILGLLSLEGFVRPGMTIFQLVSKLLAGLAGVSLFAQALLDQQKERVFEVTATILS